MPRQNDRRGCEPPRRAGSPAAARRAPGLLKILCLGLVQCVGGGGGGGSQDPDAFVTVVQSERAALLSVHGTAADDVWVSGADDGLGPVVLHWDGDAWQRLETGTRGDLWWVHALEDGTVFFGGADGQVLRRRPDRDGFERLSTPALGRDRVYGVWAAGPDDLYVVGASAGRNGFIWHYDGERTRALDLPPGLLPEDGDHDTPGLFKVWGTSPSDVWVVGASGVALRGNAEDGFTRMQTDTDLRLFTVHGDDEHVVIVGGENHGKVLESKGDELVDRTPENAPLLQGVCVAGDGSTWAVGLEGTIYHGSGGHFELAPETVVLPPSHSLHAVWVDPDGGVWAVGGDVLSPRLDGGQLLHRGAAIPSFTVEGPDPALATTCPKDAIDPAADGSIARRWNEQLLNAIRRDIPRPTVHARNLFHTSVAMWDVYAASDDRAVGYVVDEDRTGLDGPEDLQEAISYAAYRVLSHRYRPAVGGEISQSCFDGFMDVLGYDPSDDSTDGDSARAFGNRVGAAVIERFGRDGANEGDDYADPEDFRPDQPLLVVDEPGTRVDDPTMWQQLSIAEAVTQNGIPEGSGVRDYVGGHWGQVEPFAIPENATERGGPLDTGDPPTALDDDLVAAAVEVIQRTAELDLEDGVMMDISPAGYGNNPLGTNDGTGYAENPVTGEPYTPQRVLRGDFTRVLAEFWADGPTSETPPGHWNTLANQVADGGELDRRLFGEGDPLSPLAWDLHVYLALNGAVHDAAIAAWGLKRTYLSARPITLIRYMGGLGQRSDPDGPAYHREGLPLVDDLVEVITEESTAPGERHAHLARYVGEIAVRSWRGEPGDRERDVGGVAWIRAREWMPYQRRNFVTPAFPGYVSGHSTFSRSAAVVLAELTGSPYFPGGLGTHAIEPGYLFFEHGPSEPLTLQWATYFDAADQAGQSRLWGGIHIRHDDFDGRRVGARVGELAVEKARSYFDGSQP